LALKIFLSQIKKRLTLESILQTINEHGLFEEVKQRLMESAPAKDNYISDTRYLRKAGKVKDWAAGMVALTSLDGSVANGFIKAGQYPMTFNGPVDGNSSGGSVTVNTSKLSFTYAAPGTGAEAPDGYFVMSAVNGIFPSQEEIDAAGSKMPPLPQDVVNAKYFFNVKDNGDYATWFWSNSLGKTYNSSGDRSVGGVKFKGAQTTPE
jgi:hypothetical protein